MAFPHGTKRHTQNSKILEILSINNEPNSRYPSKDNVSSFVIDMIAQIIMIVRDVPDTFEQFIMKFLNSIPKGFENVHIVADCY